jgi:hypothetical protein
MTPGMPGAGIGGIFYLLSAVLMPFRELYRTLRGRSSRARWLGVGRQVGLASMIGGSVWATGWFLGLLLRPRAGNGASSAEIARVSNVLGVGPLIAALVALASVVAIVEVVSLTRRGLRRRARSQARSSLERELAEASLSEAA